MRHGVYPLLFLGALLFLPVLVHAEIYEWTDAQGVVHFTDNPDQIPAEQRQVKKRELPKEKPRVMPAETGSRRGEAAASGEMEITGGGSGEQPAAGAQKEIVGGGESGGHDRAWWQERSRTLQDEVNLLRDGLTRKKADLERATRLDRTRGRARDRRAVSSLEDEIASDEKRLNELNGQLQSLQAEARRAGVPDDWLQ